MSGIVAGQSLARRLKGQERLNLPKTTMCGALCSYVAAENADFQPMGANMGMLPPLEEHIKDKQVRYMRIAERGIDDMKKAMETRE